MKEQALDPSTRSALEVLGALSGAVIVGSVVASWFFLRRGRREHDVLLTVFETFAISTSLALSSLATYFIVYVLRTGEAIDDDVLAAIATLMVVSIFLLALLGAVARFSNLPGGIGEHLPTLAVTVFLAVAVAVTFVFLRPRPEHIFPFSALILAGGAALGGIFFWLERRSIRSMLRASQKQIVSLSSSGYQPQRAALQLSLPEPHSDAESLSVVYWSKKERSYLDYTTCARLRDEARRRWAGVETGEAGAPLGQSALMNVDLSYCFPSWPPRFRLAMSIYEQGESEAKVQTLEADEMRLFDVTGLGIV